jgi:hypothetical protein
MRIDDILELKGRNVSTATATATADAAAVRDADLERSGCGMRTSDIVDSR